MATLAAPSTRRPQDAAPAPHLSAPQRDTLAALAACLIEGAPPADETISELVARCDRRLTALPLHRRAAFGQALDALGSRVAVLLAVGRARPFADLAPADQLRCLTAWGESALGPIRAAYQSVRRLVLSVHYARPDVAAAIGYAGPLHRRAPQVPWEGPLPPVDVRAQGEPVVRGRVVLPGVIERDPLPPGVVPAGTITGDTHRTADVVVIGTGAGGAVTAARLAEAGLQVVMLESGRWHDRADFTEEEAELTERLYADGALRTTDDAAVALVQEHTVGGSTTVNWMIMLRTPDYVLEQWARESGVAGMSPAEMAPVFDRIEQEVRAGLVPEDAHSANNRLVLDGARALGWRVHSGMINARGAFAAVTVAWGVATTPSSPRCSRSCRAPSQPVPRSSPRWRPSASRCASATGARRSRVLRHASACTPPCVGTVATPTGSPSTPRSSWPPVAPWVPRCCWSAQGLAVGA